MTLKERWEDLTEGWKGIAIYIILGYFLAVGLNAGLGYVLGTPTPVVAVFSESMEPTMYKGDLVFVIGTSEVNEGDIIVFDAYDDSGNMAYIYPIIHRAISVDGTITTRGDNNSAEDPWGTTINHVHGKAITRVPLLGWVKVGLYELMGLA